MRRTVQLALAFVFAAGVGVGAYWLNGHTWPQGSKQIHIQLGSSGQLIDGCQDWSCVAAASMSRWNNVLGNIQLSAVPNSTRGQGDGNGVNDMFFAADIYGTAFGDTTLAVARTWVRNNTQIVESDIIFNTKYTWDSYRGNLRSGIRDLRRVAIHELGHLIGLGHPDDHGQSVSAIMNSRVSDTDDLVADDIAGAQAMYGGGTGVQIPFPPRNETMDFRNWLEATYQNTLGRGLGPSFVDPEGSVVWISEYLRYRLNVCTNDQAIERVRIQINGGGVLGVCGTPPSTTVFPFPPRNETLSFRQSLEALYRDELRRGTIQTRVDAEGDVVWIQEYLRYRLTRCSHDQATQRVLQQILGQGVPAGCS